MIEYDVTAPDTGDTAELVKICNEHANEGWRLVSTAATQIGISTRVYLFFEREVGEQRPPQDSWRTQHRGDDDA